MKLSRLPSVRGKAMRSCLVETCGECYFFNNGAPLAPNQHKAVCGAARRSERAYRDMDEDSCPQAKKTTLNKLWWPCLRGYSVEQRTCVVCGRNYPLNNHHVPPKAKGKVRGRNGKDVPIPTLTLCGQGNTGGCHGKVHSGRLHLRFNEDYTEWQFLESEPITYAEALEREGWKPIFLTSD